MKLLAEKSKIKIGVEPDDSNSDTEQKLLQNIKDPAQMRSFYKKSVRRGCNTLLTNTKYALKTFLKNSDDKELFTKINHKAVEIAKNAAASVLILGNIGSADFTIVPFGTFGFDKAVELYQQQARIFIEKKVDGIVLNQFSDLQNLRAAAIAVRKESGNIPLIVSADFPAERMKSGTDIETLATIMNSLEINSVGCNNIKLLRKLERFTSLPLVFNLNREFEKNTQRLKKRRLAIVIMDNSFLNDVEKLNDNIKSKKIVKKDHKAIFKITSHAKTVAAGSGMPFFKIGERINPTGRENLASELKEGKIDQVIKDARAQIAAGADALDVNVGTPMIDEKKIMVKVIRALQNKFDIPLVIDSSTPEVLEAGLGNYAGKALVNSIDGDEEKQEKILPIVKKYGAAIIGLTIKGGKPGNAEERYEIASSIQKKCKSYGIPASDIIIDTVAMSAATSGDAGLQSFEAVRKIKEELNLPTMMGISNSSFGLPQRKWVHNTFLAQAISHGLDGGIVNVLEPEFHKTVHTASIFAGRDAHCLNYIKYTRNLESRE